MSKFALQILTFDEVMMRNIVWIARLSVVGFALALPIRLLSGFDDKSSNRESLGNMTDAEPQEIVRSNLQWSSEMTNISIGKYRLEIPSWYIAQNHAADHQFVSLFAIWPGMVPFRKETTQQYDYLDRVEILIDGRQDESRWRASDIQQHIKNDESYLPGVLDSNLGLMEYRNRNVVNDSLWGWYYTVVSDREVNLARRINAIKCGGQRGLVDSKAFECQVSYFLKDKILLTYRFSHKNIADWHTIDNSIRKLVDSFILQER